MKLQCPASKKLPPEPTLQTPMVARLSSIELNPRVNQLILASKAQFHFVVLYTAVMTSFLRRKLVKLFLNIFEYSIAPIYGL